MLVVLLFIIFGIIDFGRLLFVQQSVNAASREGARVASIATATSTEIFNRTAAAADSAEGFSGGGAASTSIGLEVCTQASGTCGSNAPLFTSASPGWSTGTTAPTPVTTPCGGDTIVSLRLSVTQPFKWLTPVGGLLGGFFTPENLSASTTMRCE